MAWYIQGMPPKRVSICGEVTCPGRRACRACRRIVEAKRRAEGKVKDRPSRVILEPPDIFRDAVKWDGARPASLGTAPASAVMNVSQGIDLSHLKPGPELKPREPGPGDDRGWCKRCGELTDQWYQRTLDQARVRLCKRCKRESEADMAIS